MHGTRDEDPTEGHWSQPYPWPAVSHEARLQEIYDALKDKGYHPFSAPVGIMLDEADRPRSLCIRCAWCDGYPCLVHAKSDAEVIGVRPLLDLPNVSLLVNAEVVKLETDPSGRSVTGVVVERDGEQEVYSADIVAVCAGATNSAKILLRSANDKHPNGLANGSDQVGRNYMFHNCKAVAALGKELNPTVFQKTLGINDFYLGWQWAPVAARQHPDDRQVQRRRHEGRGAQAHQDRPPAEPGRRGRALGRLVAHDRGPANARQPGDGRQGRSRSSGLQIDATTKRPRACTRS